MDTNGFLRAHFAFLKKFGGIDAHTQTYSANK